MFLDAKIESFFCNFNYGQTGIIAIALYDESLSFFEAI
jgi:hypothetical protein